MTVTAEEFRQPAQAIVDRHCAYGFCDRCGGSCDPEQYDCSGMQCKCANVTHLLPYQICTSSFVLAQMCWDAGLYMTQAQAEADDGPDAFWAFHGANYGRTSNGTANGADGHIVLVVRVRNPDGTTKGFYTCEAMGHAWGCVNGKYEGRGWTGRYRIPGVVSGPPPPPPFRQENTMVIQKKHYHPEREIPARWPDKTWHVARIFVGADGKHLDLRGGASINGDQERTDTYRVWTPPASTEPDTKWDPKHDTIIAVDEWSSGEPGSIPGIFVQFSNGSGRPVRFS